MNVLQQFEQIKRFRVGGHRAPHKPLLILYALAKFQAGEREIRFEEAEERLNGLIDHFGAMGKARCEYPFVRLANDGVWEVRDKDGRFFDTKAEYSAAKLKSMGVSGKFTQEVLQWIQEERNLELLVERIIQSNFPETYYTDLLEALNLTDRSGSMYIRVKRNPEFRELILDAYERNCAICGYQIRSGDQLVGLEAAHIRWHAANGTDTVDNGIALCAIHHKLFDYG
ncbi:MAG: HNH endonuclease, partial [Bacteroidota bacterium]|nr:HNH endonuclease [Bacteroidota bacterium]